MLGPEVVEEYGRKRLKDLLEKGERPVIVAGFIDYFGDGALTSCSICNVPVLVRPWIFEAMVEYDLKAVCICCADPFEVKGQLAIDLAKIEEETVIEVKKWKYSRPPHIPEGQTEFVHPCGCKEYEENGVWSLKQCSKHKAQTNALIEKLKGDQK